MKLHNLEVILKNLREQRLSMEQCVDALTRELESAKAERDPFATILFAARKDYRHAALTATKSGAKIERSVRSSYIQAIAEGYLGSIKDWEALLQVSKRQK